MQHTNDKLAQQDPRAFLANIAWHGLGAPHARYALHAGAARRYAARFVPIAAFADPHQPDLSSLARIAAPGETLCLPGVVAPRHADWDIGTAIPCLQLLRRRPPGSRQQMISPRRLGPLDLPMVQALVNTCRPGPFTPAMLGLGQFFGLDIAGQLGACVGTRLTAGGYREISTVCVTPRFQGRGLGSQLVHFAAQQIEAAGERPFLHVAAANTRALALYERCGFERLQPIDMQPVTRRAPVLAAVAH